MSIWDYIRWPFGWIIRTAYNLTDSYALALLFFALALTLVLLPLSIKQQKTQIGAAKLRPRIYAIEKKYAGRNDRKTLEKKQQEIMALQQEAGYSPLAGCLPMLIQLPLILILYQIVYMPLTYIANISPDVIATIKTGINGLIGEGGAAVGLGLSALAESASELNVLSHFRTLVGAGFSIPDVAETVTASIMDLNFSMFGMDLTAVPSITNISWLVVIPILTFVASYASMKISRKFMANTPQPTPNADNKVSTFIMDLMMPAMSLFIAFTFPAALGLYWIYNSLLGILRQFVLAKAMPLPTYTDEELKLLEKEARERARRNPAQYEDKVSSRSLHHIDDEDDEFDEKDIPVIRSKFDDEVYTPIVKKPTASKSNKKKK